jgi:HJR/Mrr/RecB family endonuclease
MERTTIILVLVALALAVGGARLAARRLSARRGLAAIDELGDRDLALRLEAVYWRLGYSVRRAASGVGLILAKEGVTTAVEVGRTVDEQVVREAAAAKARHRCDRAVVVTPAEVQRAGRRLARATGVDLVERHQLLRLFESARDA